MRRLFWLALGITVGVLAMRRISQAAERFTPRGMAQGLGSGLAEIAEAIRDFGGEVRVAMSEREAELRETTGLGEQPGGPDPDAPSTPR